MSKLQIEKCLGFFALLVGWVATLVGCLIIVMAVLSAGQRASLNAGIICCLSGLLEFAVAASLLQLGSGSLIVWGSSLKPTCSRQ